MSTAPRSLLALLLDYDGTLVPLRRTPGAALLPASTRAVLRRLAGLPDVRLAIVSGRALADVRRMVALPGIAYAGNHGLEIAGPGMRHRVPVPLSSARALRILAVRLAGRVAGIPGAVFEDKGMTITVHYRRARPAHVRRLRQVFDAQVRPFVERGSVRVTHGKKVWEVRPAIDWDKGKAVRWILARWSAGGVRVHPLYAGDDSTDESAFMALDGRGTTLLVGPARPTAAQFRVPTVGMLRLLLARLAREDA